MFASWNNHRAIVYRSMHDIPDDWGTACNVQAMVFGNLGDTSATGVAFTRDPSTGEKTLYGEWLPNAQGEDVVAGIRTPMTIRSQGGARAEESLEVRMPEAYRGARSASADTLEKHFRDMQDLEFTIQGGKLYMLQCRSGEAHAARAAVRVAVEMVKEGLISKDEAVLRVDPAAHRSAPSPHARSPRRPRSSSRAACRRAPAPPAATSSSTPTRPSAAPGRASRSSWCASRPRPKTSTG